MKNSAHQTFPKLIVIPLVLFLTPVLSGSMCGGNPYEQEIEQSSGEIGIFPMDEANSCYNDDEDETYLCLPVLHFSKPVYRLDIKAENGTVVSAICTSDENCLDSFSCSTCCEQDYWASDGGDFDAHLDCTIDSSVHLSAGKSSCTGRFTATVETAGGASGTITFVNYYGYMDEDWWL